MAIVSNSLNNVNAALLLRRVVREHLELFGLNMQPRNLETVAGKEQSAWGELNDRAADRNQWPPRAGRIYSRR